MTLDSRSNDDDAIEQALLQCLELGADAEAELQRLCAAHPDWAQELAARWKALRAFGLLGDSEITEERLPERIAGFRIEERLGRGGMGVVFAAVQESTGRRVALKVIRPELLGSSSTRSRFQREIQAIAQVEHPSLCTVYEAGSFDGQPFLAMQLVEGRGLDRAFRTAREHGATLWSPLPEHSSLQELIHGTVVFFEQLARAVDAAHNAGFIHRDLKPGNVLVADATADAPHPVVLDFGLASFEGQRDLTHTGALLGTPAYMAPEQIESRGRSISSATDVHAIGVLLYEALTLQTPFGGEHRESTFRRILMEQPRSARELQPALSRDLATVIHQALEKSPRDRYRTAGALAADLRRIVEREPIEARPPSLARRCRQWVRSHRRAAALLFALFVGLASGLGVALLRLDSALDQVRVSQLMTQLERDPAGVAAASATIDDPTARTPFVRAMSALRQRREVTLPIRATPNKLAQTSDGSRLIVACSGGNTARSESVCFFDQDLNLLALRTGSGKPRRLVVHEAQERVLVVGPSLEAQLFDLDGELIASLGAHPMAADPEAAPWQTSGLVDGGIHADGVAWVLSRDGWFATWSTDEGSLRWRRQVPTGTSDGVFGRKRSRARSGIYDPSLGRFVVGDQAGWVAAWPLAPEGERLWATRALKSWATDLERLPDGRLLVTGVANSAWNFIDGQPRVWEPSIQILRTDGSLGRRLPGHSRRKVTSAELGSSALNSTPYRSLEADFLLTTSRDRMAILWRINSDSIPMVMLPHDTPLTAAHLAPNGRTLVTCEADGQAHLWDRHGRRLAILGGHPAGVADAVFSADGQRVWTAGLDFRLREFDLTTPFVREHVWRVDRYLYGATTHGEQLVSPGVGGRIQRFVAGGWRAAEEFRLLDLSDRLEPQTGLSVPAVDPIRDTWIYVADGERVLSFDPGLMELREIAAHPRLVSYQVVARDGRILGRNDQNTWWALSPRGTMHHGSAEDIPDVKAMRAGFTEIAFDRFQDRFATLRRNGTVTIHTWTDPEKPPKTEFRGHSRFAPSWALTVAQDGRPVLGAKTGQLSVIDPQDGSETLLAEGLGWIEVLSVHPTLGAIATGTRDGRVWIHTPAGDEVLSLEVRSEVVSLRFTEDGRQLIASTYEGLVFAWPTEHLLGDMQQSIAESPYRDLLRSSSKNE